MFFIYLRKLMLKYITPFLFLSAIASSIAVAETDGAAEYFSGQDLRFSATNVTVYENETSIDHVLIFDGHFSMEIGDNVLSSKQAIVWLKRINSGGDGSENVDYTTDVYLEGDVSVVRGKLSRTSGLSETVVEQGAAMLVSFFVSGGVFFATENRNVSNISVLGYQRIYRNALDFVQLTDKGIVIDSKVTLPPLDEVVGKSKAGDKALRVSDFLETDAEKVTLVAKREKDPQYRYPVNIAGVWEKEPDLEVTELADGKIATLTGRFYLWQKKNELGDLVEFQADNAVLFYGGESLEKSPEDSEQGFLASGAITAVYLQGNIVMTEGARTIRADEMFYDFENSRALAVNAEMHKFDEKRGIPVYLRAVKLRQVSENLFEAEDITLTTSEFYLPQISMTASKMVLTDMTGLDERAGKIADDSKYDALLTDVRMKAGKRTIFRMAKVRTDLERPDLPIRNASVGRDSSFGTTVQTEWYLAKILGLKEPPGTDSSLNLDYFSKRGVGTGVVVDYGQQDYYGGISGYVMKDRGDDDLGRTRKNLETGREYRGRFTSRHRQYLPYDWQATFEVSYISDKNFLESFYRNEFNTSKAQETIMHLKRLKDNWAFSFLTKVRINDFKSETEELPTLEYHRTGQSFWDNKLTYYTDTRVTRFRDRLGNDTPSSRQQQKFYSLFVTRHEVDMPLKSNKFSIVPFVAGSYGFEDQDGYKTKLSDSEVSPLPGEDKVFLGETGVRLATMFWKEMPEIQSKFWDVDGIRHIVKPHAEVVSYHESDDTIEMRDTYNIGLSQRWQTRRGRKGDKRTIDWMRFDIDATFLNERADSAVGPARSYGPAKFIYNDPSAFFLTRRDEGRFGMVRDSINTDYSWRITDTTTVLSDFNYDTESGVFQQVDVGISRYIYPDINYYIGSRYLRPSIVTSGGVYEEGSQIIIGSIAYKLNERYTMMFSQQYNADYGKNVKSELAILRLYHRLYYSLSFATDDSLDRDSIMFSIWPQGVKELSFGKRKYISLSEWTAEE